MRPRAPAEHQQTVGAPGRHTRHDLPVADTAQRQAGREQARGQPRGDAAPTLGPGLVALQGERGARIRIGERDPCPGAPPARGQPRAERDEPGLAHRRLVGLADAEGRGVRDARPGQELADEGRHGALVVGGIARRASRDLRGEVGLRERDLRGPARHRHALQAIQGGTARPGPPSVGAPAAAARQATTSATRCRHIPLAGQVQVASPGGRPAGSRAGGPSGKRAATVPSGSRARPVAAAA